MGIDGIIRELKEITYPERLGMIGSIVIIIFSFFATKIDSLTGFLFGGASFFLFTGFAFNRETFSDEKVIYNPSKGDIPTTNRLTKTESRLYFSRWNVISKTFFWLAVLMFFLFILRVGYLTLK